MFESLLLKKRVIRLKMVVFDFDGVFTDNRVLVLQTGQEGVLCSRADGFGLELLRKLGIELLVLSTETNEVVSKRCEKLDLPCIQGCADKPEALKKEAGRKAVQLSEIAYMGNDINDIGCLKIVGLPACVSDAYPEVLRLSKYTTSLPGGYGAVREFCEFIFKIRNKR